LYDTLAVRYGNGITGSPYMVSNNVPMTHFHVFLRFCQNFVITKNRNYFQEIEFLVKHQKLDQKSKFGVKSKFWSKLVIFEIGKYLAKIK